AQILTHLDAPELDAAERHLLPFARDTIWYEPAPLQRRARALREHLDTPQLLEAIGVAALANGLCRMGAGVARRPCRRRSSPAPPRWRSWPSSSARSTGSGGGRRASRRRSTR